MTVLQKIKTDQLQARKAKNTSTSQLLTTLLGECETLSKSKGKELSDSEVFAVVEKFVKNNLQTIKAIGPHNEKYDVLSDENEILASYLPSQLTEDELKVEIQKFVDANENSNVGSVMKYLKENFPNRYDGKLASSLAKEMS